MRPGAAAVLAALALASACGGSAGGRAGTVTTRRPATIRLDETANGRAVRAHVGDSVVVTLHSTYWSLAGPTGRTLAVVEAPKARRGGAGCPTIPGSGCGAVTATYRATAAGTAQLAAHRDSCGEALRCRPDQSSWTVRVGVG